MLKKTILFSAIAFAFVSCNVQHKIGQDNNWYAVIKTSPEKQEAAKTYEFTDGMIKMHGEKIGYLVTKNSYKDFELSMEYRWNLDKKYESKGKKNSGVMYNIPADSPDKVWPKGIQFQIKENTTGDFIFLDGITAKINGKTTEAGASVNFAKFSDNEKPYGEWNSIVIQSSNGKIKQFLNGKLVNECSDASSTSGKISLNYEGSAIDFRNLKLKKHINR